jgi:hypothetical protein
MNVVSHGSRLEHPMSKYPHFVEALRNLGKNNDERAARLGVAKSTLYYYLRGDMLPPIEKVKRIPELDEALTLDFQSDKVQVTA